MQQVDTQQAAQAMGGTDTSDGAPVRVQRFVRCDLSTGYNRLISLYNEAIVEMLEQHGIKASSFMDDEGMANLIIDRKMEISAAVCIDTIIDKPSVITIVGPIRCRKTGALHFSDGVVINGGSVVSIQSEIQA